MFSPPASCTIAGRKLIGSNSGTAYEGWLASDEDEGRRKEDGGRRTERGGQTQQEEWKRGARKMERERQRGGEIEGIIHIKSKG